MTTEFSEDLVTQSQMDLSIETEVQLFKKK